MGRRRGWYAGAVALAVLLAGAGCSAQRREPPVLPPLISPGETASGDPRAFKPGPAGVGDPYFPEYGNGGYDVRNYGIKIKYDPATDRLTGAVTIAATATAPLSSFNLDFAGMTVRSVTVNGQAARHRRAGQELVVTPAAGLARGAAFTAAIGYDGVPSPRSRPGLGATGFLHTSDGAFAIGEPESAATWFPVNDHPLDKATYTIEITAPAKLAAVSNGVPAGVKPDGAWATSTWQVKEPMASYLTTLAIGDYRVTKGTHRGKPLVSAVAGSLPRSVDETLARTAEIADFLETRFGPYPFEAYGGIVIDDPRIRFALETQTRPMYAQNFFARGSGVEATWVIAHELAHQWYGDSVSVRHWRDIWLNEGFATYAQWLWSEHLGEESAQAAFEREYRDANNDIWRTPPADPGPGQIFSGSVYRRGAMTLQVLRVTVGDAAFFRILKTWAAEKRNSNATTAEFITLAERVSGRSLRSMFNAWLYGKEKPPKQ
jgi:aminopeptidase N